MDEGFVEEKIINKINNINNVIQHLSKDVLILSSTLTVLQNLLVEKGIIDSTDLSKSITTFVSSSAKDTGLLRVDGSIKINRYNFK